MIIAKISNRHYVSNASFNGKKKSEKLAEKQLATNETNLNNLVSNKYLINFKGNDNNMWLHTKKNFENAIDRLELNEALKAKIIYPERELSGYVHVDGYGPVQVFRTQHNTILGPAKGGIRMLPNVDADTVRALSAEMSLKNSLAGLPLGGGKGGIQVDPTQLDAKQIEQLFRAYAKTIFPIVGIHKDIPAPDINTNGVHMDIFMDEYSKLIGHNEPGVVTGKTLDNYGSKGRKAATGLGVVFTVEEAVKDVLGKSSLKNVSCAVQGSGNVGGTAALELYKRGAKVKFMSDIFGAIYNGKGINVPEALAYLQKNKSFEGYKGATPASNEDLLFADVDVLVPAATQGQITASNASKVRAKIIAEGANGPTTPEADIILNNKGTFIVPDVLANQGGVYVSYLEYLQNIHGEYFEEDVINDKLSNQMKSRYREVVNFAKDYNVTNREAATMLAISRIANAIKARHQ